MEDTTHHTTATEPMSAMSAHSFFRPRRSPDVPEDVDLLMEHLNDPNYDLKKPMHTTHATLESWEMDQKRFYDHSEADTDSQYDRYSTSRADSRSSAAIDFDDESPYPEVRAAVASTDDPTIPVNTFRMWFLGIFFTILISGMNQVFDLRYPSVLVTGIVVQLVSLPLGKGLEKILPTRRFNTFGYVWSLNPGPFTIKEHVCITVMANVVVGGAGATDIFLAQKVFFGQRMSYAYQILLSLSTQIIGFSLGGMLRQFVVWPASMIWPSALVSSALFNTLHKNYGKRDRGHMTRERFFLIAFICSFVWYWVPGYLFTALSVFNWVCWIAPQNVVINTLFGTSTGLGMSVLTFDWSQIAFIGSPLVTPWWSELNTAVAFVVMFWFLTPILYFSNAFNSAYFPVSSFTAWDNTGAFYNASAIPTANYSPLFMSITLVMAYGAAFGAFTSVLVHTFCVISSRRFRTSLKDERDIHSRLMQAYPEVPFWWFGAVFAICLLFLLVAIEIGKTQLPIWAAFIALIFVLVLSLPIAMLVAITNQQIALQVIYEMVAGYMLPGRPVANVVFKITAYMGTASAVTFAGDMKLGHYMKVPPRVMFTVQIVATIIGCIVVTFVQDWMLSNIKDVCTPQQANGFICASSSTFAQAMLIWGGVGPQRVFSVGAPYSPVLWFFLIGAILPIPFYFLAKRYPLSIWRYVNIPVMFAGLGAIPPASGMNYASWILVGFIFNYCIRRYRFRWWMRYNYILSAALDSGVAISSIVIFFCLLYPKGGIQLNWWGNNFWTTTADAIGSSFYVIDPNNPVGPKTWS
ncbi:OPT oligopeptide transporter protein-domain-containing protein [Amanita rubescens]|nr:OPT oligopeptide transporter protein-domain-containing protein [Amanita rubescens]